MSKKVLIVGGVAGGASAAARLRRLNEDFEIIMFEKGEYISFANCGLPYYIGDSIKNRGFLLVQTVEGMKERFKLDVRNLSEVIEIDKSNKKVKVKNHKNGQVYEETYDKLILSPGAMPKIPDIKGIKSCENLFTLRNIADTDKIKNYVDINKPQKALVIGGGFIGLEMVENLHERGVEVTLVHSRDQVMKPVDYEIASVLHTHLIEKGVKLILKDKPEKIEDKGKRVVLKSGKEIETDMIILSIGVTPESKIAKEAGIEVNEKGAIVVNSKMKTSNEDIYAVGDAIQVIDFVNKKPTMIPLAWPANRQGRLVADILSGKDVEYKGTLGSLVAKVFDLTVAATGNNEKTLRDLDIPYEAIHIHPASHAGYYPGATQISFKMLFDPNTGKILGAQGVGKDGIDKRIDLIANSIKAGFTVYDLQDTEVCYAPPYNSAKDPVNMLGYCGANIMENIVKNTQWYEIEGLVKNEEYILDVREEYEVSNGSIKNVVNIPLGQLRDRLNEIPKDRKIYVCCQVGLRGYIACTILNQYGYNTSNIDGGYKTYSSIKNAEKLINAQDENVEVIL
ncbi:MAG: CoA-disulfide reductase [Terrisporobacter othiniensis]|uniref:CoA-disulfide reductase n=1 Tax=Terrisporobacter petrolearius TaxID=1460447 RepID=UPI0022E90D8D|nr:CoA-disulfide reductase [Terrisporobacter petrolearius]MDU4860272.1 CoA-disulfide reductase [Terrisporobacter othiniensis]MDU6996785.1 CoA-disulfide reductase [Terrisporobacter othiniensis]